ncbi:hypothetical protein COU62_00090 [Candidatus Pacearchaeota archaeon CG10_big_fil_rev_8_21_14_0_10_35_219]|nr:hypothetical protein [Candidatus Pacearchaeota archaeon]OIO41851.1 MAG: hypothetical protein AUJ63_04820 [Candidatus Pacearchaeota archaeon CG1_02_35_32]PIO08476.1 MAG: hypothetical protein COU62_00090 [Candidatus Pacearchaeota archaeon CG10_big_fil_rev_8_21_14_0_10_35_219]PIY81621.1 MAG: hypothetical protein COY79_01680 [Candidatus Pacearchaeota archaeon CG_4_10_14_0_8_um_filter_35_169]PIZ80105.1 MAG: hypothetical protein COY00_02445 [Candidatus Pacearchaeota archaeon CG_4_10_14_0_2_um_filt
MNQLEKELKRYTTAEKILFFFDIILAIAIIITTRTLLETQFGKAVLTFGIIMLALITSLKILRLWGPGKY